MKFKPIILVILFVSLAAAAFFLWDIYQHYDYIDAFSGATPLALEQNAPPNLSLIIDGKTKQVYEFKSNSFRLLAKTRIRTPEITPDGEIMGAYIYTGIPLYNIMEGVAPQKIETDAFDRPMDLIVVFTAADGRTARFSYGELTTTTDSLPITLAYHREPLEPTKNPETYKRNKYTQPLTGLRLICPRDKDTSRYLDNVVKITLTSPSTPDNLLPKMTKGKDCNADSLSCVENETVKPAIIEEVAPRNITGWLRIGHGRGIKGNKPATATGYDLKSFLEKNFPGCGPDDFFLVIGCDGYRSLFSGMEIFNTKEGNDFLLVETMNGEPMKNGYMMGATSDFFVDRCVWGVSHIVRISD